MLNLRRVMILLVIAIVSTLAVILYLEWKKNTPEKQNITTAGSEEKVTNGYFSVDESESYLTIGAILKKVEKSGERVVIELSFNGVRSRKFSTIIFDKNLRPDYHLTHSNNPDNLDEGETNISRTQDSTFQDTRPIEGKLIQLTYDLKSDKDLPYLSCNIQLLNYVQGKGNLNCVPFSNLVAAYAK